MASWDLIVWKNENSVDCVPSSWSVLGSSTSKYVYPKNLKKSKILKLVKSCAPPSSKYNYSELEATLKKTIKNYEHAESYLKQMQFTSNVEDNEDSEQEKIDNAVSFISQPSLLYDCTINDQLEEILKENKLDTIQNTLTNLFMAMQDMKVSINQIKVGQDNLEIAIAALTPKPHSDFNINEWNVTLPIKNGEDFEKAENLLPQKSYILVNLLALVGGLTLRHNITLMVKKLLSKNIASQYSGHGRKGKKDFSKTKFLPVLIEAARLKEKTATDIVIIQYISNALASVKDWEGGYNRATRNDNIPFENVAEMPDNLK